VIVVDVFPVVEIPEVLADIITVSDVSLVVSFTGVNVIDSDVDPATIVDVVEERL
tara:strand:- start:189 stop:353 length:165 start_codon:yes stop_codon:yes gene_type:complete